MRRVPRVDGSQRTCDTFKFVGLRVLVAVRLGDLLTDCNLLRAHLDAHLDFVSRDFAARLLALLRARLLPSDFGHNLLGDCYVVSGFVGGGNVGGRWPERSLGPQLAEIHAFRAPLLDNSCSLFDACAVEGRYIALERRRPEGHRWLFEALEHNISTWTLTTLDGEHVFLEWNLLRGSG